MSVIKSKTVAEIVTENVGADHVFSKYKIDFCCGGGVTLEAACIESGVKFEDIKNEIEAIKNSISRDSNLSDKDVISLLNYAKNVYHKYINQNVPELLLLANKVAEVHGTHNPEVIEINRLFKSIDIVLSQMLKTAQLKLYPVIEEMVELNSNKIKISKNQIQIFTSAVQHIEIAQKLIGNTFKGIANLSSNYKTPENACNSFVLLYKKLNEMEHELHKYMHFEKNILLSKALEL